MQHFERADTNLDGVLSYDEFHQYVTRQILEQAYAATCEEECSRRKLQCEHTESERLQKTGERLKS